MSKNENAAPGVTAPGGGEGSGCLTASDNPQINFTTLPGWKQAKIAPLLGVGKKAALTSRELAALLNTSNDRDISLAVERDRKAGIPICASSANQNPGYFLPENIAELTEYRRSLSHRAAAVSRTLQAIERAHDSLTGQQRIGF